MTERAYADKPCLACAVPFTPTGPRALYCGRAECPGWQRKNRVRVSGGGNSSASRTRVPSVRSTHGDGHGATSALDPQRCGECDAELEVVVVCPNGHTE